MLTQTRFSKTGVRFGFVLWPVDLMYFNDEYSNNLRSNVGYVAHSLYEFRDTILGHPLHVGYSNDDPEVSFCGGFVDPILNLFFTEVTIPGSPLEQILLHPNAALAQGFDRDNFTTKPRQSVNSFVQPKVRSLAQTVDILKHLLSDWDFTAYQDGNAAFRKIHDTNKPVSHLTYNGQVMLDEFTFFPWLDSNLSYWEGPAFNTISWQSYPEGLRMALEPADMAYTFKGIRKHPLHQLQWMYDTYVTPGYMYNYTGDTQHFIRDIKWHFRPDGGLSSVHYELESLYNPWFRPRQTRFRFSVEMQFYEERVTIDWMENIPLTVKTMTQMSVEVRTTASEMSRDFDQDSRTWGAWYNSQLFVPNGLHTTVLTLYGAPCVWSLCSDEESAVGFDPITRTSLVNFAYNTWTPDYALVDYDMRLVDLVPQALNLVALAANDATSAMMEHLSSNNIENLQQLSSLLEFIEPIRNCFGIYRKVKTGQMFEAGLSFLDVLANAKLCYEYGLAPTKDDAMEIAKLAKPIRKQFLDGSWRVPKVTYGEKFFTLGSWNGLTNLRIEAHVKLYAAASDTTLASYLLPLHALGLLPTMGRAWDNVRLSFIADWFGNFGGKLEAVDDQVLAPIVYDLHGSVCSIKFVFDIPDELLVDKGVVSMHGEHPYVSLYLRDVIPGIPSFTPSKIDFLPPAPITDRMGLSLALLWTTIRDGERPSNLRKREARNAWRNTRL